MSDPVQIALISALTTGIPSILGAIFAFMASRHAKAAAVQSAKTEENTNHMKDELVHEVRQASFAAGAKSETDKLNASEK